MQPDKRFLKQPAPFWAHVRNLSQVLGYTIRGANKIRTFSPDEIFEAMKSSGLSINHLIDKDKKLTPLCKMIIDYSEYRAEIINTTVRNNLMNKEQAEELFHKIVDKVDPKRKCPLPLNKQKGEKKTHAFLTCIINVLIEKHAEGYPVEFDPRLLTTITRDGVPVRTLARRVDGAFPAAINPIAIWEIKEYYYTTTFGSRVADGVYETLMDGLEIEALNKETGIEIKHYLFVDDYFTWWECGKSYLCRLIDIMHMGLVDEVVIGREVETKVPELTKSWVAQYKKMKKSE